LLNENLYVVNPPRISMPEVKKEIIYEWSKYVRVDAIPPFF
jgi:hypothetical protein